MVGSDIAIGIWRPAAAALYAAASIVEAETSKVPNRTRHRRAWPSDGLWRGWGCQRRLELRWRRSGQPWPVRLRVAESRRCQRQQAQVAVELAGNNLGLAIGHAYALEGLFCAPLRCCTEESSKQRYGQRDANDREERIGSRARSVRPGRVRGRFEWYHFLSNSGRREQRGALKGSDGETIL